MSSINDGVAQVHENEKQLEIESKKLHDETALFVKQTSQWLNMYKRLNNDFIFYIVGSGPEEVALKELTRKLVLEQEVVFTGQLDKESLSQFYEKSNIYIQGSSYEGLPHVILEAISHNLSIISTPIGGTNEVLMNGRNGWIWQLHNSFKPEKEDLLYIIFFGLLKIL